MYLLLVTFGVGVCCYQLHDSAQFEHDVLPTVGEVERFYAGIANVYSLVFTNFAASQQHQADVFARLLGESLGRSFQDLIVHDAFCGVGVQAVGLARLGVKMSASDVSRESLELASRAARQAGVNMEFSVADARRLDVDLGVQQEFDAVLSCDSAITHFDAANPDVPLLESELVRAFRAMAATIRPGGVLVITMRDHEARLAQRPPGARMRVENIMGREGADEESYAWHTIPHPFTNESDPVAPQRFIFQLQEWSDDGRTYVCHHFIHYKNAQGTWRTASGVTRVRTWLRDEVDMALRVVGLEPGQWATPAGFYQPVVVARKPLLFGV